MIEVDKKKPLMKIIGEAQDIVEEFANLVYWILKKTGEAEGIETMQDMEDCLFDAYKEGIRRAWVDTETPPSKLKKLIQKFVKGE